MYKKSNLNEKKTHPHHRQQIDLGEINKDRRKSHGKEARKSQKESPLLMRLATIEAEDPTIIDMGAWGHKIQDRNDRNFLSNLRTTSTTSNDGASDCTCASAAGGTDELDFSYDGLKRCTCKKSRTSGYERQFQRALTKEAERISKQKTVTNIKNLGAPVERCAMSFAVKNVRKDKITELIDYVLSQYNDAMLHFIHNLRIETPIYTMQDKTVTISHIDDACGLGKVETTNTWTISLLPYRQLRLESKGNCYRILFAKTPTFKEENVTVEGCLVPGGHLFRLTFDLKISNELKDEWLTTKGSILICNKFVIGYMIAHPFGSLESIRGTFRIAFVHDPDEMDIELCKTKKFECYYYQRHFYYTAINKDSIDHLKIVKWGAKGHINALIFLSEEFQEDNPVYLMVIASDVTWYRALKATIYADFNDSESYLKFDTIKPLKIDYLSVCHLLTVESNQLNISKVVFDYATRQFSSVNLAKKKICFEAHRIIARPRTNEHSYDFKITGCNMETKDIIDLEVHVVIPENLPSWEKAVSIPFSEAYAFLELMLTELSVRGETLCNIATHEKLDDTFEELKHLFDVLPNIQELESFISHLSSPRLQNFVLLGLDALYNPLISTEEAQKLVNDRSCPVVVCGRERASIMQFIHRHVKGLFINQPETLKFKTKIDVWCKLVPYYMRIDAANQNEHQSLITAVAKYFDKAPYGCPSEGSYQSNVT